MLLPGNYIIFAHSYNTIHGHISPSYIRPAGGIAIASSAPLSDRLQPYQACAARRVSARQGKNRYRQQGGEARDAETLSAARTQFQNPRRGTPATCHIQPVGGRHQQMDKPLVAKDRYTAGHI